MQARKQTGKRSGALVPFRAATPGLPPGSKRDTSVHHPASSRHLHNLARLPLAVNPSPDPSYALNNPARARPARPSTISTVQLAWSHDGGRGERFRPGGDRRARPWTPGTCRMAPALVPPHRAIAGRSALELLAHPSASSGKTSTRRRLILRSSASRTWKRTLWYLSSSPAAGILPISLNRNPPTVS